MSRQDIIQLYVIQVVGIIIGMILVQLGLMSEDTMTWVIAIGVFIALVMKARKIPD